MSAIPELQKKKKNELYVTSDDAAFVNLEIVCT